MKSSLRFIVALIFILLIITTLTACGEGGGGDSSGGGSISYTGSTIQSTIDDTNAEDIITTAYLGRSVGSGIGMFGAVQTIDTGHLSPLALLQTFKETITQIDLATISNTVAYGVVQSGTIPGDCGGFISYTIDFDIVTGNLSGSYNFNSYCSGGTTISGSASFSGQIDINTFVFLQISMSFTNFNTTSGSDIYTVDGTVDFNYSASPITASMDLLMRDNNTMEVYWVNNYSMTITEGIGYEDIDIISGLFYHHVYGYLDLSTPISLRILVGDDYPSSGELVGTGASGTKVKLIALSSTQYQVVVDTDGDGLFDDFDSGALNWADL